jgi:hypothetical protein
LPQADLVIRTIALARATVKIDIANLTYNVKQPIWPTSRTGSHSDQAEGALQWRPANAPSLHQRRYFEVPIPSLNPLDTGAQT